MRCMKVHVSKSEQMVNVLSFVQLLQRQAETLVWFLPLLLSLFIILFLRLHRVPSKKLNLPPSPPKLPFIGNLHQLGTLVHRSFRDLSKKYGPIMLLHLGHAPILVVSSPDIAHEILKTQDVKFANRPFTTTAKALMYGCTTISFAPYNEYYSQIKKISVQELLSMSRVQSFRYVREEEVDLMIEEIHRSSRLQVSVNLTEMLVNFANKFICRCALGDKIDTDGPKKLAHLAREASILLGAFSFEDLYPSLGWMDVITGLHGRLKRVSKDLDNYLEQVIEEHISSVKHDVDKMDFLDVLLKIQIDNKLSRENIKAIILDMFFAGTETVSTVIEWAMVELIRNPSAMMKAQEEVRRVVGRKSKVHDEDIPQMEYLKWVVKETLRLHVSAPFLIPRVSYTDTDVKGYHIPANTKVFVNVWAIHTDPEIWEDAEEFIPERFSRSTFDFKGQDYEFLPFGAGRRRCPGLSFGLALTEFVFANLLFSFDWELPGGAKIEELDMTECFGITVCKKEHFHLVPIPRFS
ncbi:hypothetical protein GIB67_041127 [Kingdonia uniflora]|uniref:Cytochrome P450 n=1 Tax=Kingdonia uniflora TaxID=39325 RepID=A0A7J7LKH0_9MAGN|nr:hypothetical protein GIB67_041127 [Kingdonia uniflora]